MSHSSEPSITAPDRLRVLVETGIALSSELSLKSLLEQLIASAARLTGARYGALGVIDRSGTGRPRTSARLATNAAFVAHG